MKNTINTLHFPDVNGKKQWILNYLVRQHKIELNRSYKGDGNYKSVGMDYFRFGEEEVFVTVEIKMDEIKRPVYHGRFGTSPSEYGNVRAIFKVQTKRPADRFW